MYTVVRVKESEVVLWVGYPETYNNRLCEFLGYSKTKDIVPANV